MCLVDRQKAINEIKKWRDAEVTSGALGTGMRVGCDKAINVLHNMPSEPEVKGKGLNLIDEYLGLYGSPELEYKITGTKFKSNLPDSVEITLIVTKKGFSVGEV